MLQRAVLPDNPHIHPTHAGRTTDKWCDPDPAFPQIGLSPPFGSLEPKHVVLFSLNSGRNARATSLLPGHYHDSLLTSALVVHIS